MAKENECSKGEREAYRRTLRTTHKTIKRKGKEAHEIQSGNINENQFDGKIQYNNRENYNMKSIKRMVAIILAVGFTSSMVFPNLARAYGNVTGGVITSIYVSQQYGAIAYISIRGTKGSNPSCSTNANYQYALSLSNQDSAQMFSMLLAARINQSPVTLTGYGVCDLQSDVETLLLVVY
jgi:hypothetical protein